MSRIANAVRSFGGKNASSSNTPSLRIGGFCTMPDERRQVEAAPVRPLVHGSGCSAGCARGCDSGSASMPTRPSRPLTKPSISSPTISASASVGRRLQRADDVDADTAARARRVDGEVDAARAARRCRRPTAPPGDARRSTPSPARRRTRRRSGPAFCASPSFTHGSKSVGASSGNVRHRLVRSPFGSISSVGHAGAQRLLDEHDAEAGLARPGHADDDAVRREVARAAAPSVVPVRSCVAGIDLPAEEEVSHGGARYPAPSGCSRAAYSAAHDPQSACSTRAATTPPSTTTTTARRTCRCAPPRGTSPPRSTRASTVRTSQPCTSSSTRWTSCRRRWRRPSTAAVMADVPNYTNITPVMQISEIV